MPCLIRRSAFYAWPAADVTEYVYSNLASHEGQPGFDDLRSAAMAIALAADEGVDRWIGATLSSTLLRDVQPYKEIAKRGLDELAAFLSASGVR